jgi:hypothetical protein
MADGYEQHWNEKHVVETYYVIISIDAASEATYKIVRKNGNFTRLKTI